MAERRDNSTSIFRERGLFFRAVWAAWSCSLALCVCHCERNTKLQGDSSEDSVDIVDGDIAAEEDTAEEHEPEYAYWVNSYDLFSDGVVVIQTVSRGYIAANDRGMCKFFKVDPDGNVLWGKKYCPEEETNLLSMQPTSDGGYIAAVAMMQDIHIHWASWIFKMDAEGRALWQKEYGEERRCLISSVAQTPSGGYIAAGSIRSSFEDEDKDVWVVYLDSEGEIAWQIGYGGPEYDAAVSVIPLEDGGFLVAAESRSFGSGFGGDVWILRIDEDGSIVWQKTYGGDADDTPLDAIELSDGTFVIAAQSMSFEMGDIDTWVLRLDSDGSVLWQKAFSGAGDDYIASVRETSDGRLVLAGTTESAGMGLWDAVVMMLDDEGAVLWQKTYGGISGESALSVEETEDGFILGAMASSFNELLQPCGTIIKMDYSGRISEDCPEGLGVSSDLSKVDTHVDPVPTSAVPVPTNVFCRAGVIAPIDINVEIYPVCGGR